MTTSAVIIPMFWLLSLVATISVGFCYGCSSAGCRLSEKGALLKFKKDLTDPSNRLASWVSDEDCCRWSGVVYNNLTGHVLELYLGTHISYDVKLTSTASVDLEDNRGSKLGGEISSSLLHLKYLRYLDLSNKDFGGIHIPKFLGSMRNQSKAFDWLEVINILPSLAELRIFFLTRLSLQYPTGYILSAILSSSNLGTTIFKSLHLQNSHLSGKVPLSLKNCTQLVTLDFTVNNFRGNLPTWMGKLSSMKILNLHANQFDGQIPVEFCDLPSLQVLDLAYNNLNGTIPSCINHFSSMDKMKGSKGLVDLGKLSSS
ncbi:receptor-like protein EIX2 [Populus alba x Populus x berolinensis]|nr:receptor-like protein EIX2 [Populus alba x Populus x berolinensis]